MPRFLGFTRDYTSPNDDQPDPQPAPQPVAAPAPTPVAPAPAGGNIAYPHGITSNGYKLDFPSTILQGARRGNAGRRTYQSPIDAARASMAPAPAALPPAAAPDPAASPTYNADWYTGKPARSAPAPVPAATAAAAEIGAAAPPTASLAAPASPIAPAAPPAQDDPDSVENLQRMLGEDDDDATPTAPAMPSAAAAPKALSASGQPSATSGASGLFGDDDTDPQDEARAQYARDNQANLKFFKSQGGITQVTPTGQEVPQYDADGGLAYHPHTLQSTTLLNGTHYRVDRDATGNTKYFDIERDGVAGTDYHVDPATGEKYVITPAGENATGSRRVVVGQDGFVPLARQLQSQAASHQQDHANFSQQVSMAEEGIPGGQGYDSLSLADLHQQNTTVGGAVAKAQERIDAYKGYMAQGGRLDDVQDQDLRAAQSVVRDYAPQAQALGQALDQRNSFLSNARQQRTAASGRILAAQNLAAEVAGPEFQDRAVSDLSGFLQGQPIPSKQTKVYAGLGLLEPVQNVDGTQGMQVSDRGLSLLPRPRQAGPVAPASWDDQQAALLNEFPQLGRAGSPQSAAFMRAFQAVGNDPGKALAVARAVLGGS